MAGKIRVEFRDRVTLAGRVTVVFVREATVAELAGNPILTTEDITIIADKHLLIETPIHTEEEDDDGTVMADELSLKLIDTFDDRDLIQADGLLGVQTVGFDPTYPILSKDRDVSLVNFLVIYDLAAYINFGIKTPVPNGVKMEYWLNDVLIKEAMVDYESLTPGDVPLTYVHKLEDEFVELYSFERSMNISALDRVQWLLERTSVKDGWMIGGDPDDPYIERHHPPVRYSNSPLSSAAIVDEWVDDSNFSPLTSPYEYLTIAECGHESDTSNKRRGMSWCGFSISAMISRLYDRALGTWAADVERSPWKFHACGIDPTAFTAADGNGYYPYFKNRLQNHDDPDHHVSDKFRLIKLDEDDDELWLESSWSCDWVGSTKVHEPFDYTFGKYPNAWEVLRTVSRSLGYGMRSFIEDGVDVMQHLIRSITPALVSYPDPLSINGRFYGAMVDGVNVAPKTAFGKYMTARRTATEPSYDNTPLNATLAWDYSKTAEFKEPHYDDTEITIVWDNEDHNYFNTGHTEIKQSGYVQEVQEYNDDPKSITLPRFVMVKNPIQIETCFGLFGNFPLLIFGGNDGSGELSDGYENKMDPEFVYVPAGSVAEKVLLERWGNRTAHTSAFPGLICLAGTSADHGKTITDRGVAQWDDADYFRGVAKISVPYDGEYKECFTARTALAVHELPLQYGDGDEYEVTFRGLSSFKNDRDEVGYNSIYPGLGMKILNGTFRIRRTVKDSNTNIVTTNIKRLPAVLPVVESDSERPEFTIGYELTGNWIFVPRLYWKGSGGDINYELIDNIH